MACWQAPTSGSDQRPTAPTKFADGVAGLRLLRRVRPELWDRSMRLVQVFDGPAPLRHNARGTRAMGPGPEHDEEQEQEQEQEPPDEGKPPKLTPLVRRHPVTSELALHGSPQSFLKFEGLPVEESRTLL